MPYPHPIEDADPSRPGHKAGAPMPFGAGGRYIVYPVHTRFARIVWFVEDSTIPDPQYPILNELIRQDDTFDAAVKGLK